MSDLLTQLGLTANQARIYRALIPHASLSIAAIARASGLHRALVHKALPKLEARELVERVPKGKRTEYKAAPPRRLEKLILTLKLDLQDLIPSLEEDAHAGQRKPLVTFQDGSNAIQNALIDMAESTPVGGTLYRYRTASTTRGPKNFSTAKYEELIEKKQIQRLWIANTDVHPDAARDLNRSVAIVPKEADFHYPLNLYIYGDTIAYLDFETETVITIKHKTIATFQRQTFLLLFKTLPKQSYR